MKKAILSLITVTGLLILLVSVIIVSADPAPALKIGQAQGLRGETVNVSVSVQNNPGFNCASVYIDYDKTRLLLQSAKMSELFAKGTNVSFSGLPQLTFLRGSDISEDGEVFEMTFKILDDAQFGDGFVTLKYDKGNISNYNEQDVDFDIIAGEITVKCPHTSMVTVEKVESTCVLQGHDKYTKCEVCGEILIGSDTALPYGEHDWSDWTVTKPATEQEEGEETRVCKNDSSHIETRTIPKLAPQVEFNDVVKDAYYEQPVQWAVANSVTNGTGENTFSPNNKCTRAQVVTFLWRAAGQAEPASSQNPFTDVKEDDYFYKAVLWAVENNITTGTSKTTFSPASQCTRGQVVTFLWRAKGQTEPTSTANPFTDVKENDYFYKAVLWAVENDITKGTSATTFSPNNTCTRGQVVTFLYRAFK